MTVELTGSDALRAPQRVPITPSGPTPLSPRAPGVDPSFDTLWPGAPEPLGATTIEDPQGGIWSQVRRFLFGGPATIDVEHPVTLFPQPTGMTCWSAAATMLFGDRSVGPGGAALGPTGGLVATSENVQAFARAHDLVYHAPQSWTVEGLADLLAANGPLWVAGQVPSGHAYVIGAIHGDGSPDGTRLTIYDPWPPGRGRTYDVVYGDWMRRHLEATTYVLHR